MASFSILNIIVIFLIINANSIGAQRASYFPNIARFISKPDSDLDDYDDLHPRPLGGLPIGPGPIAPMPLLHTPFLGGVGSPLGFNPLARLFPNPYQQQSPYFYGERPQRREEIYTAIGYDKMDPSSQMRITITERRPQSSGMVNTMLGGSFFNTMGMDDHLPVNYETPSKWYIQGAFIGSQLRNKAGTYYLVLTEYGRTADGCSSESLGPIVTSGMMDMTNPFSQNSAPLGVVTNPVLVGSGGPTVYASTLEGVSRRQLVGAGLAACQYINNGVCGGYIPFCATVSKDSLPSMEVPMATRAAPTTMTFDPFATIGLQGNSAEVMSFAEEDRSVSFNNPQSLARQGQQTGSNNNVGLLF